MGARSMARHFAARLALALPIVFGVLVLSFFLTRLVPGDPTIALVGDFPAPQEYLDQLRREFGLDEPLLMQLWLYVSNLVVGDFGYSFANRQAVLSLVLDRALNTLLLMIPALIASSIIGVGIALLGVRRDGGVLDTFLTSLSLLGSSIPAFWLGQMLIVVFAVYLGWLPAQGMFNVRGSASGFPMVLDFLRHWILPGAAATFFYLAVVARVARASLRETLNQDFIITAQAKGIRDGAILVRHVLPNAMIPVIIVVGYNFGFALTGAILIEAVFAWPGLGGLFMTSIVSRDYPVLQAIFILTATTVVLSNLVTDIVYSSVDPRVRDGYVGK